MAIIYTYPTKSTPTLGDLILISDTSAKNLTKNATISSLKDAIDVVDSLNSLTGAINITGGTNITVTPSGQNIEISTSASNVDGSGTAGKIPKWSDSNTLTDSVISESSSKIGIGTTSPTEELDVVGNIKTSGYLSLSKDSNSIKISTPATITTSYELVMPETVGTASQVLKLPSTIGTSPYQLSWGDASASSGASGFQTIPLSNSDAFITATGTFVFQSIVGASLSSTMFFKVFNLLQLSSGRSARVGIFKGSLSEASSATLHSTGSLSGLVAAKTFSAIEMEKADGATDLVVGETIVVCVSVDENISMLGTTTAISNEFIGLFSTSVATAYETLDGLITSLTFNSTGTRISALLYN